MGQIIKAHINKFMTKYRNGMCSFWGHRVNENAKHIREREEPRHRTIDPEKWFLMDDDLYHFERYSRCKRCAKEIRYIRWANVWMHKERAESFGYDWIGSEYYSEKWNKFSI